VGAANYLEAFATPAFRIALRNVGVLICVALLIQVPLALASALLVGTRFRGVVTYRLILLLPYVLAQTATGIVFTFLYDGQYGLAGKISESLGLERLFVLGSESLALPAIAAVMVWKYFGFGMMIFVAALQSLDHSIVDAAHMDGADRWQVLRYVTLPHLRPTMLLVAFFAVLGAVQMFDLVMSLTAGGPNNASQTLVTYLYTHGLSRLRIGYGSAVGMILFCLCVLLSIAYGRLGRRAHG
jgi:raffinose/stachyose/melibiose transport system permease protein